MTDQPVPLITDWPLLIQKAINLGSILGFVAILFSHPSSNDEGRDAVIAVGIVSGTSLINAGIIYLQYRLAIRRKNRS